MADRKSVVWSLTALHREQGLQPFMADWNRLNDRLMQGHPVLEGSFVHELLRHFGTADVMLAKATVGADVIALLLIQCRSAVLGVWSSFLPSQMQIGPCLVPDDLDFHGLFAALPGHAGELDLLCIDPRFGDLRHLPRLPVRTLPHALTMGVRLSGPFDDYWAQRPRKLIQNMRRYRRRLQSEPLPARLDIIGAPDAVRAAVARYAVLESGGWKGREGTAITGNDAQGNFYSEVISAFAARGEALVYELWLGESLIASRMLLLRGQMVVMLKTTFDEEFERFAPGRLLLMMVLEDLFQRVPGGQAEFYTDAGPDLLAWSTSQRWINHVSVYRHTGLPAFYSLLRRSARGWLRRGKRPVGVEAMVSRSGASIHVYPHVNDMPADALGLMKLAEKQHIELGADWHANLVDTVYAREPHAHEVLFHVLRRKGRVLAVLPTVTQSGPSGREVSGLSNFYTAIYAPALVDDLEAEDLLPLTRALRRNSGGAAAYRFSPMDPASREFTLLKRALALAGLKVHAYFAFGNWYEPVHQNWAEYLQDRSGQLRSTIRRNAKRFAAEGGRLEIVQGGEQLEAALAAYQAVYAQSWKVPEPYPDFVPGLVRLCARRGWLRLGVAWLGDQPVAAQLWIVANGRADIYKLAYDESHKALAPGTLLTALLMEHALDVDRVHEIDYLIGDDSYKAAWMGQRRERFGLIAYDPLTARGLLGLARQAFGETWRRLRAKPAARPDNPAA